MSNVNKGLAPERPTIPAEVADLIENMRKVGITNQEMTRIALGSTLVTVYNDILSSIPFDTLLAALVNGYERELAEDEKRAENERDIQRAYETHRYGGGHYDTAEEDDAFADGIRTRSKCLASKLKE